ncbi:MAG: restriction endonuclease subunit S [Sphingobacteriaceae bacterium]|nr:restriction endonuclease subunit S [Sphingobacteriaceae bacterium]
MRDSKLKQGWEIKKLGEVCEKASSNISQNAIGSLSGIYPVFGAKGFIKNVDFYHQEKPYIGILKDGAGAGRVMLLEGFSSVIGTIQYLVPNENINIKYFYYFLLSMDFTKYINGSTIPHIYFKDYKEEPFLLSPIPEQEIIVSILDKAFSTIEHAKQNAGKNLKNAKELFDSYLNSIFTNKSTGTTYDRLDSLCELIVDCEHKTAPIQERGIPSIRTPNIGKGVLILDNVNRVSEQTYREWTRRAIPQGGDLILAREAPAGNIAIIPDNMNVCLGQRTVLIRTIKNRIIPKFLAYLILSNNVQRKLLSHSTGATVTHINMKDIRAFKIFDLNQLSEQQKIVQQLEALSAETKQLEAIYQQKLIELEDLKKSILQKAFNGELVA